MSRASPPAVSLAIALALVFGQVWLQSCNISSFLGGVMSFSLHGWLWLIAAIPG